MMERWMLLILLSSVFLAFYDICKKAGVRNNAVLPTLFASTVFGCAAYVVTAAAAGGGFRETALPAARLMALSFVKAAIVASSWVFTFMGLRTLPITIATPIRASAPAAVFIVAFFLYGEIPSLVQFVGVVCVLGGYWTFSWAGKAEGIDFFRNRAVWCAIAGAALSAVSSIWDKYLLQVAGLPVKPMQFWFQVFLVVIYGALLAAMRGGRLRVLGYGDKFEWRWAIPMTGILLAAADFIYFTGIAEPGVPISAASLLRRFSVVITFVLGARIFREKNLLRKALALGAILAGVVLLCVK
ncbi:MAG: DMT family transporter [Kiritimatiellae bacterium]|nr:DMT family transporter [Kiritimatiellia bacterium]